MGRPVCIFNRSAPRHSGRLLGAMSNTRFVILVSAALSLCIALSACTSPEEYAAKRRQRLLVAYPPGTTARADVQKRWAPIKPDVSETRPASGWTTCPHTLARIRAIASEHRTGHIVNRCERYLGPDGWSGGLCYCWFYYDSRDYILDADWQWHTD